MPGSAFRWLLRLALVGLGAGAVAAPARAGVVPGQALDGPSPDVLAVGGVAMAADGGGAVAYLRRDGGVPHVFVSLLGGGTWAAPVRVDAALGGPAAQPAVAASAGGRVAFLSGGALYASVRPARAGAFTAPQALGPAAGGPSLSMGVSGTAYLAYPAPGGTVRAARLDRTASAFAGLPDALGARPAGAGSGPLKRPRVAVAADATSLVAWGEDGADGRTHVMARRVYGLHVGSVLFDVTLDSLDGRAGGSADLPDVGIQDDSSYAWIAFRQTFAGDGTPTPRAVVRPLVASQLGAPQTVDALAFPSPDGAGAGGPSLAIDGAGDGLVATAQVASHATVAATTAAGGFGPGQQVNQVAAAATPAPVAAVSRTGKGLVAFAGAQGTIEGRLFDGGVAMGEATLSRPDYGPVLADGGLAGATDGKGDAIVAYLQGDAGARRLAVAAVVDPPGSFTGLTTDHFVRVARLLLRWTPARGAFSPITYVVMVDGKPVGTTGATSLLLPAPLSDGVHRWQVVARDSLGQQTPAPERTLRIAARPPVVTLAVVGPLRAGAPLGFTVGVRAAPGVARVTVDFGDGRQASGARVGHRYAHAGHYAVRVTVVDRVGNRAVLKRALAIA